MSEIKFGEATWAYDWEHSLENNQDRYLVKLKFWIDGEKGYSLVCMDESPETNPNLYNQVVQKMKDDLPGTYERGEIQEPPTLVAD